MSTQTTSRTDATTDVSTDVSIDADQPTRDPGRIRRAEVLSTHPVGEGMIRVVLGGEDMTDFASTGVGDEYVRLFLPHPGQTDVVMPFASGDHWEYPEGADPGPMRCYTIRALPAPGQVAIDFVVHEGGVAASWAQNASPGDVIGMNTPKGLYERPEDARWQLLVADATGLPALARLLEQAPPDVRSRAVVEVPDASHRIDLTCPGPLEVVWLVGGNGHGPSGLLEALQAMTLPSEPGYVWFAGEARVQRAVRKHLRHERRLPGAAYKVVGYWIERAEEWTRTWEGLDGGVRSQLEALWADETRDPEAVADEVDALYDSAGL
ncbi:NADPH-dependent ferric siderophore reductase, contains FAD-binding and SIP domains [Quadrisphaera granulorum]|uniref:NADPH-dependent ferric siderophore reductase n=1 Tax=Quadrisphaera granulorum TaxID=317664 RepID=A0A315ZRS6_9ACTN|nr:siderophore-interacting protein [Quadrisphaera granulorum]PWJ47710.1 NADPH-dependent ferric siderophore reductase [Quadrisphaera granulorum]SZE98664.1 NADPH-dependent ferric siderophore reductase, contains FAD-binding and SIP domains [Quadrisphaera granulorum]